MEFEIWWLLSIPIFFGLGWIAARIDIKQLLSESRSLPKGYFKGLNFLLNEQPDKAIDAFIEIVRLDPETADRILHWATFSDVAEKRNVPSVCTRTFCSAPIFHPNSECRPNTNSDRIF